MSLSSRTKIPLIFVCRRVALDEFRFHQRVNFRSFAHLVSSREFDILLTTAHKLHGVVTLAHCVLERKRSLRSIQGLLIRRGGSISVIVSASRPHLRLKLRNICMAAHKSATQCHLLRLLRNMCHTLFTRTLFTFPPTRNGLVVVLFVTLTWTDTSVGIVVHQCCTHLVRSGHTHSLTHTLNWLSCGCDGGNSVAMSIWKCILCDPPTHPRNPHAVLMHTGR